MKYLIILCILFLNTSVMALEQRELEKSIQALLAQSDNIDIEVKKVELLELD